MSCNSLVLLFNVSFTTIQSVLIPLVLSDFFFFLYGGVLLANVRSQI